MTGKVVTALSNTESSLSNANLTTLANENQSLNSQGGYTNIQVATSVTFMVGLIQVTIEYLDKTFFCQKKHNLPNKCNCYFKH